MPLRYIQYQNNPEFEKHIPDIHVYQTELQLNKANTSDKQTSLRDLNIKVLEVTTNRPWASIDPPPPLVGILKTYMVK